MKGKYIIMCLLCALLVGLVPPSSARAEDEFNHYDAETKSIYYNGQSCYVGDACASYIDGKSIVYVANGSSSSVTLMLYVFPESGVEIAAWLAGNYIVHLSQGGVLLTQEHMPDGVRLFTYKVNASTGEITSSATCTDITKIFEVSSSGSYYNENSERIPAEVWNGNARILYSDLNIWDCTHESVSSKIYVSLNDTMLYSSDIGQVSEYSFYRWCSDASLNCVPSTRTNLVYEEFIYNSWFDYVVTKNEDCYSVFQFYSNNSIEQFTEFVSYDNRLYLHLKDDISGTDFFIKRFDYVADGWLCSDVSFCTLKYGELVDLGVVISDDNKLFYSSETIKTGELYGNIYYSKNTEFTQGFAGEVSPDHNPIVTPTSAPSNPSGGSGVQNQTLYMYSKALAGSVIAPNASLYEVCNGTDEQILIDLLKGMSVSVHGWTSGASGAMWYYCTYTNVYDGEVTGTYTGFIESSKLGLGGLDNATEDDMSLKEQLETISAYVLSVPLIIGALFSFLPPWCLTLTGIGFSVLAIVMVRRGVLG